MLTESYNNVQIGRLDQDIHLPSTVKLELVEFIAKQLPKWRDHPDRPTVVAETILTEHLCDHLNSATHSSIVWSHIQFRTETTDETHRGRKVDLTVKPCAAAFIIEGRRHSQFDPLFPIECKRLPTPNNKDRDEREYVITEPGTTGGIQRFKFGYHGAAHTFAAMIAYVQERTQAYWLSKVNSWIMDLSFVSGSTWSDTDTLQPLNDDPGTGISTFKSLHARGDGLERCELRHLWITMS